MVMTSTFLRALSTNSPKSLFKFLLRESQKLPREAQQFYKHSIKQSFKQHVDEPDPERVKQIMEKALSDAKWVLQKYKSAPKES